MKETNLKANQIIFLLGAILLGCFYWFEYRPSEIRKKCSVLVSQTAIKAKESFRRSDYEYLYKTCLEANGLKAKK